VEFHTIDYAFEDKTHYWKVSVWGDDDSGMEMDFLDERSAWQCFIEVIGLDDVTVKKLKELGFKWA
jgi:hypothetical protein